MTGLYQLLDEAARRGTARAEGPGVVFALNEVRINGNLRIVFGTPPEDSAARKARLLVLLESRFPDDPVLRALADRIFAAPDPANGPRVAELLTKIAETAGPMQAAFDPCYAEAEALFLLHEPALTATIPAGR